MHSRDWHPKPIIHLRPYSVIVDVQKKEAGNIVMDLTCRPGR